MPAARSQTPLTQPLRGEIWEFDLRPRKGREQKGIRPCLIVSTNAMNRSTFGTVILCPLTTTKRPAFAWRVPLQPDDIREVDDSWRARPSWIQTDQIVTVDTRSRARRHLATVVESSKMARVDDSLRRMLAL